MSNKPTTIHWMKYHVILGFLCSALVISCASLKQNKAPKTIDRSWINGASIYEANIRQYTPEGTFNAFEKHLPRLADMGIKIIWLMPIHPIGVKNRKGTMGSYYAVKNYKEVNPDYGSLSDFKDLVKKCHSLGIKVIIDWVANHTSPDNPWATSHLDWYTLDSMGKIQPPLGTDWWDVADLNFNNQEMRLEMIESMKYWLKETDIDGFRCDIAGSVPLDFWQQARKSLDVVKPVFMLAEWEDPTAMPSFDMDYGWEFHHLLHSIAKGEKSVSDLDKYLATHDGLYSDKALHMYFVTNHDENSWNGTTQEKYGPLAEAFTVLNFAVNGMPLIFNGEESNLSKRLAFFEKDTIPWKDFPAEEFYKKLVQIKANHPALANAPNGAPIIKIPTPTNATVYAFSRRIKDREILYFINTSPNPVKCRFDWSPVSFSFNDVITGKTYLFNNGTNSLHIPPYGYYLFQNQ